MRRFDVAIIGCGNVSQMHLDGCLPHPERVRVVACCDSDKAKLERGRLKCGIDKTFTSLEEVISNAPWDVGIVCTPTPVRERIVRLIASAARALRIDYWMRIAVNSASRTGRTMNVLTCSPIVHSTCATSFGGASL